MKRISHSRSVLRVGAAFALAMAATLSASVANAHRGDCGQPVSAGVRPAASDALVVLKVAVGAGTCGDSQDDCECDVNDSGDVTGGDALVVLRSAVGFVAHFNCAPTCVPPTTIPGQTTTTEIDETTTTLVGETTTTEQVDPEDSTTTTFPGQTTTTEIDDDQGDLLFHR